jgi:uncharacterized membrane protein
MQFDLFDFVTYAAILASVVILALGTVRAIQIGHAFVNRAYRLRAYWGALLMFSICLGTLTNFINFPATSLGAVLMFFPFAIIVFLLLAFVDRGIEVAMDGDFFHRDILHWRSMRGVAYAAVMVTFLLLLPSYYFEYAPDMANSPLVQLGADQILFVVPVVFAYAVTALIIGGRRTADQTMKRHIRRLGFGFLAFIVSFPFFIAGSGILVLFPNVLIIVANWFLYRAVMSLSSIGKVEREPGLSGPAPPAPALQ